MFDRLQASPAAPVRGRQPAIVAILSEDISYHPERKRAFRAEATRLLRQLAAALGLEKGAYDLRWNEGGIAVSGEATLHGEAVYVQVSQGPFRAVLFRRCEGRRDYRGQMNHWASAAELADPVSLAGRIAHELQLPRPARDRLL